MGAVARATGRLAAAAAVRSTCSSPRNIFASSVTNLVAIRRLTVRLPDRRNRAFFSSSSEAATTNDPDDNQQAKAEHMRLHPWESGNFPVKLHYYQEDDSPASNDQPNNPTISSNHQQVIMRDARQLDPPASLDTQGFALVSSPSLLSSAGDFQDTALVKEEYFGEVRDLVRDLTGATQVGVYDHAILQMDNCADNGNSTSAARVHCDYTEQSGPLRLHALTESGELLMVQNEPVDPEFVKQMLLEGKGFAFVNVWRSIMDDDDDHESNNNNHHPALPMSLAVCDALSVPVEDRIVVGTEMKNRSYDSYSLRYNEAHQWYTYPRLQFHESLVYKVFDTQEPRFVFHSTTTALLATSAAAGSPSRSCCNKSIEVRTIAFFDGATEPPMDDLLLHSSLEKAAARYLK